MTVLSPGLALPRAVIPASAASAHFASCSTVSGAVSGSAATRMIAVA
jgi:hypothetical protein